ncbi:hypothetical protein K2173_015486 [Erythroxylum novogranatense]|uniref:Esophageal cancer associated protein n=1 Tax=Erythroxylum novogranatense TaxID=1862640 RepID=A0AAV8SSP3_9ROSI|nr:hypothetical protein K2173_015486 [Erythroxylum novogranatense]
MLRFKTVQVESIDRILSLSRMEFRQRDYIAEEQARVLPRSRADNHPLSTPLLPPQLLHPNINNNQAQKLSARDATAFEDSPAAVSIGISGGVPSKEWTSFKRILMQKFPVSKMISVSSMPDVIRRTGKAKEMSLKSTRLEELDDTEKVFEDDDKIITRQEYVSRLHELKDEITRAWHAEDCVTALRLSIKVAKLLMDTTVLHFYPTLFVLATDILDMLGEMVWERIRQKAEFSENGSSLYSLPEKLKATDICSAAKETCNNWFFKVGSIRELLPRIYLELAILPCWRFLLDHPEDVLQRLVMMTRGIANPLASAYCHLYMAHCARKLHASHTGFLVTCVNDMKILLRRLLLEYETSHGHLSENRRLLVSLMEPTIEYIMKCIFEGSSERLVDAVLMELGFGRNQVDVFQTVPCVSIVLHHLLKELPVEVVSSNAMYVLDLIKSSIDSSFDQCLNYRLLGFKLSESRPPMDIINKVLPEIIKVASEYDRLDEYLKVVDAYVDIVLQNEMDNYLNAVLEGISERAVNKEISEDKLGFLQSFLTKLLSYMKDLTDIFALSHFLDILDVMHGGARNGVDMHILKMATRDGSICDQSTIQFLFEISQSLHDGMDFVNVKDDENQQAMRLISRFIQMVDYGLETEQHLTFLVECRVAFGNLNDLKDTLVHSSNCLAIKALKDDKKHLVFVKSCVAFGEVTIRSISSQARQLSLYLETAEVALMGGLVSHSDGLIVAALGCLESVDLRDGPQAPVVLDGMLSSICKLCGLVVMVPGNCEQETNKVIKNILSLVHFQSWMTPKVKTRVLCTIVLLLSTLSQNKLPYHSCSSEILGNDMLFFGETPYAHELISLSEAAINDLVNYIEEEPSKAARGSMALEACNCIASSFKVSHDVLQICWKLLETARLCLNADDRYLQSTTKYIDHQLPSSGFVASLVT